MSDKWHWQQSEDRCPKCSALLEWADDPNQDHWGSSVELRCRACGYWAPEWQYQIDIESDPDDDFDDFEDE